MVRQYIPIDLNEYEIYDEWDSYKIIYDRMNPTNSRLQNNRNRFIFKINLSDSNIDIAEEMAYRIAQKIGISCCEAVLTKRTRPGYRKTHSDFGVRSYYSNSSDESICGAWSIVCNYIRKKGLSLENSNIYDIDLILDAIFSKVVLEEKRPYKEFLDIKQGIIDMVIYDIKFGNYDRTRDNWCLRKNKKTGKYSLYPMYDNEVLLGLESETLQTPQEIAEYNNWGMSIIRPQDRKKGASNYLDLLEYLVQKYPRQTQSALVRVNKFTYQDLDRMLDEYEGLSEDRKTFVKKVFLDRDFKIRFIANKNFKREFEPMPKRV